MRRYQHYRKCHKCKWQRVFKYLENKVNIELGAAKSCEKISSCLVCNENGCVESALKAGISDYQVVKDFSIDTMGIECTGFQPADEVQQASIVEIKTEDCKKAEAAAEKAFEERKEASTNGSIFKGFCKYLAQCISDKITEALK